MKIRAMMLAGLLGSTMFASAALAAETNNLADAAKAGNTAAVRTLLAGPAKADIAGPVGTAALIWAASRNDKDMVDLLLAAGADSKGANEFGATAIYAAVANTDAAITTKLLA